LPAVYRYLMALYAESSEIWGARYAQGGGESH
jgi:hypothetical protein